MLFVIVAGNIAVAGIADSISVIGSGAGPAHRTAGLDMSSTGTVLIVAGGDGHILRHFIGARVHDARDAADTVLRRIAWSTCARFRTCPPNEELQIAFIPDEESDALHHWQYIAT